MFMQTTPFITVRASRPLTELEFCGWMGQAAPGDRLEYHRGYLVLDTYPLFSALDDKARGALAKLAARAFRAAEAGLVHLVQERVGPDEFAYIAIARPKPVAAEASLSALLLESEAA